MKRQNVLNKKKKKKGFTLIELIIVMAIMAVLAVVAIPKYAEFKERANKKHDLATAKTIANATSGLVAEDEFTLPLAEVTLESATDTNADKIEAMLQSIPVGKTEGHTGNFKVKIESNGTVHVLLGNDEVYPDTADVFK